VPSTSSSFPCQEGVFADRGHPTSRPTEQSGLAVVAVLGCVAIYLVRSRRLAAHAITEVRDLRRSIGESGPVS
jgi:hypothetical protein